MSAATEQSHPVKSGAAGAATFPGSDSRKFNYFEPKGRKATHYEDMTFDVQPDPERYLLQDWIISFPDGTPTYSKNWTKALSSNWHQFRAVDQEWERTHYQRQSTICGMVQGAIENARKSGAPKRFDRAWVKILQDHLVPLHRGFDGSKFNGGLGGPRARPESQCCARRPGSV